MYGKLNTAYGWAWKYEDNTLGPFILKGVERYAGMLTGYTPDGRKCARPLSEFEALSTNGEDWHPTATMLAQVPPEATHNVRIRDVPLPIPLDEDQ